jgi:hypothetical protein
VKSIVKAAAALIMVALAATLGALDWPSQTAQTVANFGGNNKGTPQLGDSFTAKGPITAVREGELIIAVPENNAASRLPSTLGAWIALDHGDGMAGIYARVDEFDLDMVPKKIDMGTVIANCGSTGWSEKEGFYLSFYDRKERRWVNPSLVIPPREDTRAPFIQSVKLIGANTSVDLASSRVIKQGRYTLNVSAYDTRLVPQESLLAPFKIICSVNGTETGALTFDTFSARDGVLMVYRGALTHAKQVYAPFPAVEAGEVHFTRGQVNLAVMVQDISGNPVNAVYKLSVE